MTIAPPLELTEDCEREREVSDKMTWRDLAIAYIELTANLSDCTNEKRAIREWINDNT